MDNIPSRWTIWKSSGLEAYMFIFWLFYHLHQVLHFIRLVKTIMNCLALLCLYLISRVWGSVYLADIWPFISASWTWKPELPTISVKTSTLLLVLCLQTISQVNLAPTSKELHPNLLDQAKGGEAKLMWGSWPIPHLAQICQTDHLITAGYPHHKSCSIRLC